MIKILTTIGHILNSCLWRITFYYDKTRYYIYSGWMCSKLNINGCYFRYPINSIHGIKHIKISDGCYFGKLCVISAWSKFNNKQYNPLISIGNNTRCGDYLHITCINKIKIGSNVLMGRWVTISDNSHGQNISNETGLPPNDRDLYSKGPVIIEDNVWIGDKVTILAGVTIGKGSIVGANSVVTKNVAPTCIVAGNPAKLIKYLN